MHGRKALVVGATGMVGLPLSQELHRQGWQVWGAARLSNPERQKELASTGIEVIRFDVTNDDPGKLPEVEMVFLELWDPGRPELIWPINYYGVGRLVEHYAGRADFINGCTINVYGDQPGQPDEAAACRPTSEYGRSRYAQERLIDYFCHRGTSRSVHVRYAHSNSAKAGMVRRMAEKILAGESLGNTPDARTQVIAIEDFVRVTIGSVNHLASPSVAVNCCHPRVWTQRELAEEIQRRLGRGEVVFDRYHGGGEHSVIADVARMLDWFGPPEISLDTVLDRVVADLGGA